ncbi:MAG: phosphoribosylglycinamide formyltransferase [Candidatus Magnetomorum sp.]|nr:phosphoribosylglycinamide formyltransferase [Candidatus Magnetomorum sp.]
MQKTIKLGALISGGGTNLQAIIDCCESGKINAQMAFVGSDTPNARGLERAKQHNIPHFVVDYTQFIKTHQEHPLPVDYDPEEIYQKQNIFSKSSEDRKKVKQLLSSRILAERSLLNNMANYDFDLLVLAGFMRNLTPYFIDRINTGHPLPRIMNIHPALLPSFPGTDGYGDTFNYGCKVGGCTVHFVDYGEDSGPIIGQKSFAVTPEDTEESIRKKGLALEWELYPECIQLFAENRLKLQVNTSKKNRPLKNRLTVVVLN